MDVTQYRRYALTGGIGSGKSTVARMFRDLGAVIIDADAISRELMEPGQEVLARTVNLFGESVLNADGTLNRARLAERIFAHDAERKKLNAIVHPKVRARASEIVDDAVNSPNFSGIIIDDIPLLVETQRAAEFDAVIAVQTDLPIRLERLSKYRNMSYAEAQARISAQSTDQQRSAVARWVITNSGSREDTQAQVQKVWNELCAEV